MKTLLVLLPLLAAACANGPPNMRFRAFPAVICGELLGTGWKTLPAPPANADALIVLSGTRPDAGTRPHWFSGTDGAFAVCHAGEDVCDSSAHVFRRSDATWRVDDEAVHKFLCFYSPRW